MTKPRHGGSFAPALDAAGVARYEKLIPDDQSEIADALRQLVVCWRKFHETPASTLPGEPHPSGMGTVIPLEPGEIARIWDVVPWASECDRMGRLFDSLPAGPLRNAAYHLLWYARELTLDREPITRESIQGG